MAVRQLVLFKTVLYQLNCYIVFGFQFPLVLLFEATCRLRHDWSFFRHEASFWGPNLSFYGMSGQGHLRLPSTVDSFMQITALAG
jgi:hypothetical protein